MARKPRQEEDTGSWMNTYSDMVTLLMTFFVLLFSMSSVDAEKWEAFVKAFANPGADTAQVVIDTDGIEKGDQPLPNQADGEQLLEPTDTDAAPLPMDFSDLYAYLKDYVEENALESSVEVFQGGESVVYIRFQNNIFFAPDQYQLLPEADEILGFVGDCLHNVEDEIHVISINGHTASVTYETSVSDWMLSSERASNVAIYFEEEKGIDPIKLRPIGYGKNFPIESNDTEEGRKRNRRVDMVIVKGNKSGADGMLEKELLGLFDPSQFPRSGGAEDILIPPAAEDDLQAPVPPGEDGGILPAGDGALPLEEGGPAPPEQTA